MLSADLSLLDTVYTESSKKIRDKSINSMRNVMTKASSIPAFGGQERKRKPHGGRRKRDHRTMLRWLKFRGTGATIEEERSSTESCATASDDEYSICSKELLAQAKNRLRELCPIGIEDDDLSISNSLYTVDLSFGERFQTPEMSTFEVSDDDLSIGSEDLLAKAKNRLRRSNLNNFEDNDDLLSTTSSLNTCRQSEISGLKKKIHTSEITRHELFNRCAELQKKVENADCNDTMVEEYCQQSVQLREDTLNIERHYTDEVSKLVTQMADLNKKYTETVSDHDNKIAEMQLEICRLKEENMKLNTEQNEPTK